jgi:hypothetical protein
MILNCLVVRNRVMDASALETSCLSSGNDYMHEVELVSNIATWALDFTVESHVKRIDQLCFANTNDRWQFRSTLEPGDGSDGREYLKCKTKRRSKDSISTTFRCDSGHSEQMVLTFKIKS